MIKITLTEIKQLVETIYGKVAMDTRFWEVWDDKNHKFIGLYSYGDLMNVFNAANIEQAYGQIRKLGYFATVVDDLYPLEKDSVYREIQALKVKERKKEAERNKKQAKSRGFKLTSIVPIGKYKGITFKDLIDKYPAYMIWAVKENVFLLNPEIKQYMNNKTLPPQQQTLF